MKLQAIAALVSIVLLGSGTATHAADPALKTIRIDGDLSDWNGVLAHSDHVTHDGVGAKISCSASRDRDCRISSEKEDMRTFAWTWDDTYVYVYLARGGGGRPEMAFWFYMDLDGDERMGRGDKVLRVRFQGSNRTTSNDLFPYVPRSSSGDPMVDGAGRADGYTLPGNCLASPLWSEGGPNGGAPNGLAFEERVPWSRLGVAPGTAIFFHVGSSNSPNPTNMARQMDDNLGGPDGGIGSFGYVDVSLTPDRAVGSVEEGGSTSFPVTLTNEGNLPDTFRLTMRGTQGLPVVLERDAGCDGTPDGPLARDGNGDGDFDDPEDSVAPGADSDGDGFPDSGLLQPGESVCGILRVETSPGQDGLREETTLTATSGRKPGVSAGATFTTYVGSISLRGDPENRPGAPGGLVPHPLQACNSGPADAIEIEAGSSRGEELRLEADADCDGVGEETLAVDGNGDGTWDQVLGGDSNGDGRPDTGTLAPGECRCFVMEIRAPVGAPTGVVDVTTVTGTSRLTGQTATTDLRSTVRPRIEMDPDYTFAEGTEKHSGPGASVFFSHTISNNWHVADEVDFTSTPPGSDQDWPVRVWTDPNGDGNISDGEVITHTPPIAPNGGTFNVVVEVMVPAGAPAGQKETTVVTASSLLDPSATDSVTDEQAVAGLRFFAGPGQQNERQAFAPCETIHVEASGLRQNPDGSLPDIYDLYYFDGSGNNVRLHDPFLPDATGVARDSHDYGAQNAPGTWRIEIHEEGRTLVSATLEVVLPGVVRSLESDRPGYPRAGSDLTITSVLENTSAEIPLGASTLEVAVLSPDATLYLDLQEPAPRFLPFTGQEPTHVSSLAEMQPGAERSDQFTARNVAYPEDGAYLILEVWRGGCGAPLALGVGVFSVGGGETDCGDGVDNDLDGQIDCEDEECARAPQCFETDCGDGMDNDADGATDCDDADCSEFLSCLPEVCDDDVDNNDNGRIDCEEPACASTPACPETNCNDGLDNNGNGMADCMDPDCSGEPNCVETGCRDGVDNDGDGATDCDDFDCSLAPECQQEICDDGTDNDGDGLADCDDPDCSLFPACGPETDCRDGQDNDQDGRTDCDDADCSVDEACREIACEDGFDDDGDTLVDCDDPDCDDDPVCAREICNDGIDNDGDGSTDCGDSDCLGDPVCPEHLCDDGVDNDRDGLIDCADPSCASEPRCQELLCADGIDNDGDGLIDCRDPDCAAGTGCTETECGDGFDNDGDGLIDCADPDCVAAPAEDCDGDGVDNATDCAPADPGAFGVPPEIYRLYVSKRFEEDGSLVVVITGTDVASVAGPELVYDGITGLLTDLHSDRGFRRSECVLGTIPVPIAEDYRTLGGGTDGYWYLGRARNGCGSGAWGPGSFGPRAVPDGICPRD